MTRLQDIVHNAKRLMRLAGITLLLSSLLLSGYVSDNGVPPLNGVRTEIQVSSTATCRSTVCFRYSVLSSGLSGFHLFNKAVDAEWAARQYERAVETAFKHTSEKVAAIKKQEDVLRSVYSPRDFEGCIIIQSRG